MGIIGIQRQFAQPTPPSLTGDWQADHLAISEYIQSQQLMLLQMWRTLSGTISDQSSGGLNQDRPPAGVAGRSYISTDLSNRTPLSVDDGSQWQDVLTAQSVGSTELEDLAVTTAKIADLAVDSAKIANVAVTNAKIADLAVTTAKIADLAVNSAKITDLAVTSGKIDTLAVTTAKIADLAVDTLKIAGDAVTTSKIGDAQIITSKIGDAQVITQKVKVNAITGHGVYVNDAELTVTGSNQEAATLTLSTDGGQGHIVGKVLATISGNGTPGTSTIIQIDLTKDTLTGTVLDAAIVRFPSDVYAVVPVTLIGYDATPAATQIYKLKVVGSGTSSSVVSYRRLLPVNLKK